MAVWRWHEQAAIACNGCSPPLGVHHASDREALPRSDFCTSSRDYHCRGKRPPFYTSRRKTTNQPFFQYGKSRIRINLLERKNPKEVARLHQCTALLKKDDYLIDKFCQGGIQVVRRKIRRHHRITDSIQQYQSQCAIQHFFIDPHQRQKVIRRHIRWRPYR